MNDILHEQIPNLVAFLTSEMSCIEDKREKWAGFKTKRNNCLCQILGVDPAWGIQAGSLINFDIDPERKLILLNYSSTAHNLLHEIPNGWTPMLRMMRGLVYSYENPGQFEGVKLVSRGFEKFFNQSELPENSLAQLGEVTAGQKFMCVAKEDGHMIEYFRINGTLCATTRGKLNSPSAIESLSLLDDKTFQEVQKLVSAQFGIDIMSLVCEFIHPTTQVHVDYQGAQKVFLLEAYDVRGRPVSYEVLQAIGAAFPKFELPVSREMSLDELLVEINDRSVHNREGWVAQIPQANGQIRRVKFKYIAYIGEMVKSKLSYKYLMRCIQSDRLNKMLITLPEEIREVAYAMTAEVLETVASYEGSPGYTGLYQLYTPTEGSIENFRNVCRGFYRHQTSADFALAS
jgi:hypothetical protein